MHKCHSYDLDSDYLMVEVPWHLVSVFTGS